MKTLFYLLFTLMLSPTFAQTSKSEVLPYRQIPEYPADYSAGNVMTRLIDGLGYRFYWATEGLTEKDLALTPAGHTRNMLKTVEHIYQLTVMVLNASKAEPNIRPANWPEMTFEEMRRATLLNLQQASTLCKDKNAQELSELPVTFQRGEQQTTLPYWHIINGPISDAIYHTGQIVMLRRMSGNPINPKVNVFMGKNAE